jgi:elongation factor G
LKVYETEQIRNVGLAGQSGGGKTSLAEALLFAHKVTDRLGNVPDGNTVSDYDPEEVRRVHSISLSLLPFEHDGIKINLLDIPGRRDFVGDIRSGVRVSDALLLVIDAASGVEPGSEFAFEYANEFGVTARAAVINRMDKERANFETACQSLEDTFSIRTVPVTLPLGQESKFEGVIDLVRMKLVEEKDGKATYADIPESAAAAAKEGRAKLVEAAAEGDDELTEKFLDDQPLSDEEILRGLKEGMLDGRFLPVLATSSTQMLGLAPVLDFIRNCFPHPLEGPGLAARVEGKDEPEIFRVQAEGPALAFVYKTVSDPYAGRLTFFKVMRGHVDSDATLANLRTGKGERLAHVLHICGKKHENIAGLKAGDLGAVAKLDSTHTGDTLSQESNSKVEILPTPMPKPTIQMAVVAKNKADEDKIGLGFHRLIEQDPTLQLRRDPEIAQTILSGMGNTHVEVATSHLKEIAKVEVDLEIPKVAYRETITKKVEGQGKYKKQSGGRGQYGDCWIRLEPQPEGSGFTFEWEIVGGVIPTKYQPAVEKGLIEAMEKGVLSGSPTVDIKAACYDGSYHDVDSSEMAFKVAASMAFKSLALKANPVILEPIYKIKITVPEHHMGDVMGDMSGRRGRVIGTESNGKRQTIVAQAPLAELFTYSRDLRSMTRGRGVFEIEFDHYDRVPPDVQEKIVAAHQAEKSED